MLSLIGIIIALAALIVLAMKGFNIILISPFLAIFVMLMSGMDIIPTLTGAYMQSFAGFATNYFLVFMLGAVFAKLMEDSGAAKSIANGIIKLIGEKNKFAIIVAVMVISAVLTYGGISLFVCIFAVMPIARPLFKKMDIPWGLFLGSAMTGLGTFTMTCLPGTPQIQNIIPTTVLGTTLAAAPVIGIIAAVTIIAFDLWWLRYDMKKLEARGIGFEATKGSLADIAVPEGEEELLPHVVLSLVPLAFLLIVLNFLKWHIVGGLLVTCVLTLVIFFKHYQNPLKTVNTGATNVGGAILNTCAIVGFGGVVAATVGYQYLVNLLVNMPGNPLISWTVGINLLAGVTGSASGGLTIAMNSLAPLYTDLVNPEVLHRIGAIASGGLDSLPHNGAVITTLTVCGLTHKQGYKYVGMTCIVGPIIASAVAIIAATILY